jgi:hypothetical protein
VRAVKAVTYKYLGLLNASNTVNTPRKILKNYVNRKTKEAEHFLTIRTRRKHVLIVCIQNVLVNYCLAIENNFRNNYKRYLKNDISISNNKHSTALIF